MKKLWILTILLCFLSIITEAQVSSPVRNVVRNIWRKVTGQQTTPATPTYYFSSSTGNDSNSGLTPSSPFASLTKLSTLDLSGSVNKVAFKKGDYWEGSITIGQSGTSNKKITFDSYGTGANPIIYGSDEIASWTVHSGSIYKATYVNTINQLFIDGERLVVAREPETGFYTVDAAPTTSQITSAQLNGAVNHTGAYCLIHSSSYGLETKAVTGSSSTTITLVNAPFGNVNAGEKFIVVGKLEYLDSPGEWYYDSNTDVVYVWLPDSGNPNSHTIRGSITDYGLTASSKSNFEVKNIQFAHQRINGINLTSCNHYTVSNITVSYVDDTGIADLTCDKGSYLNNTIIGANHRGLLSELSDSMLIQSNNVSEIALFENLGLTGLGPWYGGSGIAVNGNDNNVLSNNINTVGYNGISFNKRNTIKYNYINNYCLTKNDGGGIYTSMNVTAPEYVYGEEENKNSVVQWNTILNGVGVTTNVAANANAIYLDESSGGVIVKNNNIGNCTGWGIFWHKGNHHITRDNILYACKTGMINTPDGDYSEFVGNYIYGKTGQLLAQHVNSVPTVTTITWDSNHYVNHYATLNFNVDWTGSKNWAFWRSSTGFDAHTTYDTTALATNYKENFLVNSTSVPVTFYRNNASNVKDAFTGEDIGATVTLQGFSSKVITGLNPDCYLNYQDSEAPVISEFIIPETAEDLTFAITTFTVTGEPTQYYISTSSTAPTLTTVGWTTTKPTTYTVPSSGTYTIYVWCRDTAGNISLVASDGIVVSAQSSLFDGLVLLHEMETSGTTSDDASTNNLDGTNKNSSGVTTSITATTGLPGNGYPYISTGVRQTDIDDNSLFDCFVDTFTVAGWVNVTSLAANRTIAAKTGEWALIVTTAGVLQFRAIENNTSNYITVGSASSTIATGTNYFIVLKASGVKNKTGYTLYLNNNLLSTTTGGNIADLTTGIVSTSNALNIGYYSTLTTAMYGTISQLGIWDRSLTTEETTYLYNSGSGRALSVW